MTHVNQSSCLRIGREFSCLRIEWEDSRYSQFNHIIKTMSEFNSMLPFIFTKKFMKVNAPDRNNGAWMILYLNSKYFALYCCESNRPYIVNVYVNEFKSKMALLTPEQRLAFEMKGHDVEEFQLIKYNRNNPKERSTYNITIPCMTEMNVNDIRSDQKEADVTVCVNAEKLLKLFKDLHALKTNTAFTIETDGLDLRIKSACNPSGSWEGIISNTSEMTGQGLFESTGPLHVNSNNTQTDEQADVFSDDTKFNSSGLPVYSVDIPLHYLNMITKSCHVSLEVEISIKHEYTIMFYFKIDGSQMIAAMHMLGVLRQGNKRGPKKKTLDARKKQKVEAGSDEESIDVDGDTREPPTTPDEPEEYDPKQTDEQSQEEPASYMKYIILHTMQME